jgi:hypothetical protein
MKLRSERSRDNAAAGVKSMLSTKVQHAVSMMAAFTARRVLSAWKAQIEAIAAERAAEAEQLCKLRIQEARKMDIASRFHRVWQLHSALKAWQTASHECVSTRAAQAQAAMQEDAISARMEIAAQFHNHFQVHAVMDAWRRIASSLQQERQAAQQAQIVQSKIDAVLARVRAGKVYGKSHLARAAAADRDTSTKHADTAGTCSIPADLESRHSSATVGMSAQCPTSRPSTSCARSTDQATGRLHTAVQGELQTLPSLQGCQPASTAESSRSPVTEANVQDMHSKQDTVMPFPGIGSAVALQSGASHDGFS